MKKNQNGFALIESLLIIIILVIIGFTGYYIWQSQKENNKVSDDTLKSGNSQTAVIKNDSSVTSTQQKYLTISQWGVRAPYSSTDTFTAQLADDSPAIASVVSANLSKTFGCTDFGAGQIQQLASDETVPPGPETVEQAAKDQPNEYIKVGNYYYHFVHDQAACSDKVTVEAENAANDAVKSIVPKFEATAQN